MKVYRSGIFLFGFIMLYVGCTYENEIGTIVCPEQVIIDILSQENTVCGSSVGQFEVLAQSPNEEPFQYRIQNGFFQNSGQFENLSAGTYMVIARLTSDCEFTQEVTIENAEGLQVQTSVESDNCDNSGAGKIVIEASNATGEVQYSINGQTPGTNNVFDNLTAGVYEINVVDEGGCSVNEQVEIQSQVDPQEVYDLVEQNCALSSCHGGTQSPNLSTPDNIESRKARILARTSNQTMPPSSSGISLTDEQIELIKCWAN